MVDVTAEPNTPLPCNESSEHPGYCVHCGKMMGGNAELVTLRPKRSMGSALRALDYRRKGAGKFQRCSRCHAEHSLDAPIIYNLSKPDQGIALQPVMVANELLGFICSKCFVPAMQHFVAAFPDGQGLPVVDTDGYLMDTPRCECGTALGYANDGRTVVCPICDFTETTR